MSDVAWELDFTGRTTAQADINAGKAPDGYYRVVVTKVEDDQKDGHKHFFFRVVWGPMTGYTHRDTLFSPKHSNNPEKAMQLVEAWAHRMGLVDEKADGRKVSVPFSLAVGREVIIRLVTRPGKDGGTEYQNIGSFSYDLWNAGHPKLVADVYPLVGLIAPAHAPKGSVASGGGGGGKGGAKDATTHVATQPMKTPEEMAAGVWGTP